MEDEFAKIVSGVLSMYKLSLPRAGVRPLDVQVMQGNHPFGRFALTDLFEGDFSSIPLKPAEEVAALNRVTSADYDISGHAGVSGLPAEVAKAKGSLSAMGVRKTSIKGVEAWLTEADEGALHRALQGASVRSDGPLAFGAYGVVITATLAAKQFEIDLATSTGGKVEATATLAQHVSVDLGAAVKVSGDGHLKVEHASPVVFAVRCWVIKKKLIGSGLKIVAATGPLEMMGDEDAAVVDREFAEALDLKDDGSFDLGA